MVLTLFYFNEHNIHICSKKAKLVVYPSAWGDLIVMFYPTAFVAYLLRINMIFGLVNLNH